MADVGELLIRIAFEVDPEGAKKATSELQGLSKEMKATGSASQDTQKRYSNLHRELSTSTRAISMAGMGIAHLGMALGTTGAISQSSAAQLTTLGSALTAGSTAVRMMALAMDSMNKIFNSTNLILIGAALAIAGAIYAWQYFNTQQKIATGNFKDFNDVLASTDTKVASMGEWVSKVAVNLKNWVKYQDDATAKTKEFRDALIGIYPILQNYADLQERLKGLNLQLTLQNRALTGQRAGLAAATEGYTKWKNAMEDAEDAQEALEDGARSLKMAQMDLNDLLAEGTDVEKKWQAAQNLYKSGHMKASDYAKAQSEYERYQLRVEGTRDAIDDQVKSNEDNQEKLTEANKTIKEMSDIWGIIYGNVDNMKIAIDKGNESLVALEATATNIDSAIFDAQTQMAAITEMAPNAVKMFLSIETSTGIIAENMRTVADYITQMQSLQGKTEAITTGKGGITSMLDLLWTFMTGTGATPTAAGGAGVPYVSRDTNMRVHTGEAIVPANQNSYADNISIKNLSLSRGYGMDMFMKDRDRAIRIKRKMLGYS